MHYTRNRLRGAMNSLRARKLVRTLGSDQPYEIGLQQINHLLPICPVSVSGHKARLSSFRAFLYEPGMPTIATTILRKPPFAVIGPAGRSGRLHARVRPLLSSSALPSGRAELRKVEDMHTRYAVSLNHAGCNNRGTVVWQGQNGPGGPAKSRLAMISLPRGFVNMAADDCSMEILCAACNQTVASAVVADVQRVPELAAHSIGQHSAGDGRRRLTG